MFNFIFGVPDNQETIVTFTSYAGNDIVDISMHDEIIGSLRKINGEWYCNTIRPINAKKLTTIIKDINIFLENK